MDKKDTLDKIKDLGLLAVIRGPSAELTVRMVEALVAGGVLGIEITYSTPGAAGVVKTLAGKFGDEILLGMGTLTEIEQVAEAQDAGARFIVSPHCEEALGGAMVASQLGVMIGALDSQRSHASLSPGRGRGQDLPRIARRAGVSESLARAFPSHSNDAHRRCKCRKPGRLVRRRRIRRRRRQRALPASLGERRTLQRYYRPGCRICQSVRKSQADGISEIQTE